MNFSKNPKYSVAIKMRNWGSRAQKSPVLVMEEKRKSIVLWRLFTWRYSCQLAPISQRRVCVLEQLIDQWPCCSGSELLYSKRFIQFRMASDMPLAHRNPDQQFPLVQNPPRTADIYLPFAIVFPNFLHPCNLIQQSLPSCTRQSS